MVAKLEPGREIDGFTLVRTVKRGGMASLWRVTRAGDGPLVMKIPADPRRRRSHHDRRLRDGADDPAEAVRPACPAHRRGRRLRHPPACGDGVDRGALPVRTARGQAPDGSRGDPHRRAGDRDCTRRPASPAHHPPRREARRTSCSDRTGPRCWSTSGWRATSICRICWRRNSASHGNRALHRARTGAAPARRAALGRVSRSPRCSTRW